MLYLECCQEKKKFTLFATVVSGASMVRSMKNVFLDNRI